MIASTTRNMLFMLSGWLVWSSCFVVLYAGVYLGCLWMSVPPDSLSALNLLLTLLWIGHLAVLGFILWRSWVNWRAQATARSDERRFIPAVTLTLNTAALVGTVWLGIPVTMVPPCP